MKLLILFTLCLLPALKNVSTVPTERNEPVSTLNLYIPTQKLEAYKVLQTKCNVCHATKNKTKVFTLDNMTLYAPKIKEQVFIKKKMPKGKDIVLTPAELAALENWLNILR